jgi:hypothetical protein
MPTLAGAIRRARWTYDRWTAERLVQQCRAIEVPKESAWEVHVLTGDRYRTQTIALVWSLYRFLDVAERGAIVLHDDGTLTPTAIAWLRSKIPNVRVSLRPTADAVIRSYCEQEGWPRLAEMREQLILMRKLLDTVYAGRGKTVLVLDTDILFFRRPTELLEALTGQHAIRYNADIASAYAWPAELIPEAMPNVNAGLVVYPADRTTADWSDYEGWLARLPPAPERLWYIEQTLLALECGTRPSAPLPLAYDVSFRAAWDRSLPYQEWLPRAECAGQISQHYCGSLWHRGLYFRHLIEQLRSA